MDRCKELHIEHLLLDVFGCLGCHGDWQVAGSRDGGFPFAIAEAIEALSLERARNAIKSLTALAPETAEVMTEAGWKEHPVENVVLGSRIRVRTGSRVPLDARVESGRAALDQAPITGESLPVDKAEGIRYMLAVS